MSDTRTLKGLAAAPGVAIGPALIYTPELGGPLTHDGDVAVELARLDAAIGRADTVIAALEERLQAEGRPDEAEIFAAHRTLLADPALRDAAAVLIADGHSAAAAFDTAAEAQALELESLDDEYLSARATDLRDIAAQVARALSGAAGLAERLSAPAVVIARDLGPSDLVGAPREKLLGFALAAGGLTAHTSILARAVGLPAVVGLGETLLKAAADGTLVALDGGAGTLTLDPPADEIDRLRAVSADLAAQTAALREQVGLPPITGDGRRIALVANASTPDEAAAAREWGAEGVGLLRTELLFLDRASLPGEAEQQELYAAVAAALPNTPITVRTLDVGGDKQLPAFPLPREDNPFLGWRGLRIGLSQPEILLPQLRALLRAGAAADIRIMLPMVSTLDELRQARALLEQARATLREAGAPHARVTQIGVMIEVPAAALNAEALAREADFFSIGTNDLTQYTLACDRTNSRVADLYQPLDPAVLRLIHMACAAAHRHGRHAAVCGELASDPQATALLIGLGVDELSCAASALPRVRAAIRATDSAAATVLAEQALACSSAAEVRELLAAPGGAP